jgi:hypothetical protein
MANAVRAIQAAEPAMLEKLPDAVGHALRDTRAGLDKTAFQAVDLRPGTASIQVTSLAFTDHAPIPARYTADGDGLSPPLQWGGAPATAATIVVIVEDADSPTPQPLVHAIVVGLVGEDGSLPEGALPSPDHDGQDLAVGRNSYLRASWLPPDPPPGHGVHRYVFQVFALDDGARFDATPGRDALLEAVAGHGLASGCLIGTYERPDTSITEPRDSEAAVPMVPAQAG